MKKLVIIIAASILAVSCNIIAGDQVTGNGNIRTEKRKTNNFSGVKTSGSIDIEIAKGDAYSVSVEDDDNVLPYVITEVNDGYLNVHYKDNTSINNDHVKVYITAPSLDKLSASGSGDISTQDIIKNSGRIEMDVTGSGSIKGSVEAPSIKVDISGSGSIELKGRTKDFDCSVSGSGDLDCSDLESENTTVKVFGSGNAHVFASVHLSASVAGSGDVYYRGNPTSPEISTAGSGTVQAEK
jgi:hypothetical protein